MSSNLPNSNFLYIGSEFVFFFFSLLEFRQYFNICSRAALVIQLTPRENKGSWIQATDLKIFNRLCLNSSLLLEGLEKS